MINIDFLTLKAFFIENIDFLIGARIQKIQQPSRRDFIFVLRNYAETKKLYINISPQIYHICFMNKKNDERRNLIIPQKPPMFCMLLRKYIDNAKIVDAKVVENERILELYFEIYDELSERVEICLAIELMGKYSNVILYNRNDFKIIGCAHNVGADKSSVRELIGGIKYVYPPFKNFRLSDELKKQFKDLSDAEIEKYINTDTFKPAVLNDRYTLFKELLPNSVQQNSVNDMLDNYYSKIQSDLNLKDKKNKLSLIVNTKIKKNINSINKISDLLKSRDNGEKYKLYGELLTANLYQKANYQKNITVYDYINSCKTEIPLDEKMTLNENAQRYYKLYTKSKTTKEKTLQILSSLNTEKQYLESLKYSIDIASGLNDLDDISEELGLVEKNTKKENKKSIQITKIEIKDFEIYVGKNNKQNDYIVSKLKKDNDFWFHTRDCAGSHVLLKVNNKEPDDEIIFECCKLAKQYSSSLYPSKIEIIYTKGKNVSKPNSAQLGYVIYKNEKSVLI